jgi:hypothetical protein
MRSYRAKKKMAGLKPHVTWVPAIAATYSSHRLLDARSLAMHCVIAERLRREPDSVVAKARENLARWRARAGTDAPGYLEEWARILSQPWAQIAGVMTDPGEEGTRLRQSSPFAGVLTSAERRTIYAAFRT